MNRLRLKRIRHSRNKLTNSFEIPLTPLIDTALTLLIIFMVTTHMLNHENSIKVDLPKGKIKESENVTQEVVVSVDKNSKLFLNDVSIKELSLLDSLKKAVVGTNQKAIFVKADRTVSYGQVLELVDKIKSVDGIDYVALATQGSSV